MMDGQTSIKRVKYIFGFSGFAVQTCNWLPLDLLKLFNWRCSILIMALTPSHALALTR